jgi:hypothetical protein
VLELLDREEASTYNAADMETLGLFANQAAVAIETSRTQKSLTALLGGVLGSLVGVPNHRKERLVEGACSFAAGVDEDPSQYEAHSLKRSRSSAIRKGHKPRQSQLLATAT